jgi:hypothetical protein
MDLMFFFCKFGWDIIFFILLCLNIFAIGFFARCINDFDIYKENDDDSNT